MSEIKDENPLQELLNAIISSLEPLEARSEAVYQFLKVKGGASDKDLAPFLEQAANASNVRWRAFRVRAEGLIAGAMKEREKESRVEQSQPEKADDDKSQTAEFQKLQDDAKAAEGKGQADEKPSEAKDQPNEVAASRPDTRQKNAGVQEGRPDGASERGKSSAEDKPKQDQPRTVQPEKEAPKTNVA